MSEGFCDVDFSDTSEEADVVDFFDDTWPTARKPHRCVECREAIEVGEQHKKTAYRFNGSFHSERRCLPCVEVAAEFEYTVFGGGLWNELQEEWSNGANLQGCLNRLTTARAKAHMRQRWARWKGVEP